MCEKAQLICELPKYNSEKQFERHVFVSSLQLIRTSEELSYQREISVVVVICLLGSF